VIDIAAQFGDNLVRQRKLADISQDELSVRASVHRTEISQLERGLRIPRIDTVVKLATSLEIGPGLSGGDQLGAGQHPLRKL
jgi:transcriptional regulator with XRE-family HTH domain